MKAEQIERFTRLIKQLGPNNRKGTARYQFEVDMTYALRELEAAPEYLQGKKLDEMAKVVYRLVDHLKEKREQKVLEAA